MLTLKDSMEILRDIEMRARTCGCLIDNIQFLRHKRNIWINKPDKKVVAFVGNEEDGFSLAVDKNDIILQIESAIELATSDLLKEKAQLIELLEILKQYESDEGWKSKTLQG